MLGFINTRPVRVICSLNMYGLQEGASVCLKCYYKMCWTVETSDFDLFVRGSAFHLWVRLFLNDTQNMYSTPTPQPLQTTWCKRLKLFSCLHVHVIEIFITLTNMCSSSRRSKILIIPSTWLLARQARTRQRQRLSHLHQIIFSLYFLRKFLLAEPRIKTKKRYDINFKNIKYL